MNPFTRTVIGYHGCSKTFAEGLLSGQTAPKDWRPSQNAFDWLGHGIYFWEDGPTRAWRWARERAQKVGEEPAVIGAIIQLGYCFDLTDEENTRNLGIAHSQIRASYKAAGKVLPTNRGAEDDQDLKGRFLDCLVVNYYLNQVSEVEYQTVRCAFREGRPAYDGAMIYEETHVQVVVIDPSCVVGVFRPT